MKVTTALKLTVIAGCAALAWGTAVSPADAATAQSTTTATVVIPLSISKSIDLNFGKFLSGGSGGTVVVSTGDVQSTTGGVSATAAMGASAKAAAFSVTGEPSTTYAISYPAQTELTGPGASMTIGTFTNAVDEGSVAAGIGTLPADGSHTLLVGATLTVGANQVSGTYAGTLDVAVNYN